MLFSIILFMADIWKIQKYIAYHHIFIILGELQNYSVGMLIEITMIIKLIRIINHSYNTPSC